MRSITELANWIGYVRLLMLRFTLFSLCSRNSVQKTGYSNSMEQSSSNGLFLCMDGN